MEIAEAEDRLVERLSSARESADLHLRALDGEPPASLLEVAALGLDTNILKALRRDPSFAEKLFLTLQANNVALIAPGQAIVEYWNNHRVFASDEWSAFGNDLGKLTKRIESDNLIGHNEKAIDQIRTLVQSVADDLQEAKSPEYLNKSKNLIKSLLETATTPRVSRSRLAALATVRMHSKMPPGFADEKNKSAPWGDFFVWCDFLLGALCVEVPAGRSKFVWVTDEMKPDWKTGAAGHPSLLEEFQWVRDGGELSILSLVDIRALLVAEEARSREEADEEADEETDDDAR